ncbi:hypothetical protein AAG906_029740 [Vitis piasezkii]
MMRSFPSWLNTLPSGQCWKMDVKTTFLHGDLEELVYMVQPEGFIQLGQEHLKILGMEIHRDRALGRLWLSQYSYVKRVLERFNMDDAKPCSGMLDVCYDLYKTRFDSCWVLQTMASCSANNKSEYMAIAKAAKESLWLIGLVKELGIQQGGVQLYCDSQSAIYLAKNQVITKSSSIA